VKAKIEINLKEGILDPQGKAIHHALESLGFNGIHEVRTGKLIEIALDGHDRQEAGNLVKEACEKLLANSVIEKYTFSIVENSTL